MHYTGKLATKIYKILTCYFLLRHRVLSVTDKRSTRFPLTSLSLLGLKLLIFEAAFFKRLQPIRKMSYRCWSRKEKAIFRCFINERFASASEIWFISSTRFEKSCTPMRTRELSPLCRNRPTKSRTLRKGQEFLSSVESNQPSLVSRQNNWKGSKEALTSTSVFFNLTDFLSNTETFKYTDDGIQYL